ncbi:hypothetical protein PRZ48_002892 [Zasmidium cellare]|uniref:FAD-binding domain-containing protein n=1 Tax=Zasmidium cellare TaxID=395010 RepID=A0ABR0EU49_ZASCE|nr:hypothetical protein PRZ48_002892 [Zasmidium cellare]
MAEHAREVDVLIVGAGPVGLVTAFQLAKFGGVSVAIIDKNEKATSQQAYGRAITLFPRTSELLDQLGLAEKLAQQCFACRETVTYNSKGEEVEGRGWSFMETSMNDTAWDFALVLRQKYQEDVFRGALNEYGVEVEAPFSLLDVVVDETAPALSHKVTAAIKNEKTGQQTLFKSKFLIGCDGGHSSVRRMLNIPFHGTTSADKWVRIDGLVKTNVPKPRTYCSIESPTHGNVLWVGLDRGRTRIGYAFTEKHANSYEVFDEAAAIKEAKAAVKPFDLEFECVDWWTIYSVGQRIAESFFVKDCVFLAGDACHTHSSGAAQGMNTGIHDSVNLAWKLSLVLRGAAHFDLLRTYQAERLPNVQRLIQYDKDISRLMTNRLPENWTGDPDTDVNAILGDIMGQAASFSSGLGIFYDLEESNPLNRAGSQKVVLSPGQRGPDVDLVTPGTYETTRLIQQTRNSAMFHVVVFAGGPALSKEAEFYAAMLESTTLTALRAKNLMEFLTILKSVTPSTWEVLGHDPLGRAYFDDSKQNAYQRYGIDTGSGGVAVLRPDGWIGTVTTLSEDAVVELESYFQGIFQ